MNTLFWNFKEIDDRVSGALHETRATFDAIRRIRHDEYGAISILSNGSKAIHWTDPVAQSAARAIFRHDVDLKRWVSIELPWVTTLFERGVAGISAAYQNRRA